jgi:catechol 2,3-dioxygenase-like lactoylglutathione lyase family enzyme
MAASTGKEAKPSDGKREVGMLSDHDAMATIAVRDLAAARRFYEDTLGFAAEDANDEVVEYTSGNAKMVVYRSEYAGTNEATSATWGVGKALDALVAELKRKGVTFEHYDLPGLTLEGDVHVADGFKAAWFRDPDGNILHINGM